MHPKHGRGALPPSTLSEVFERYVSEAPSAPAIHPPAAGQAETLTRAALDQEARRFAALCQDLGVGRNDIIVLALDHPLAFAVAFWGAQLAGAPIAPLPRVAGRGERGAGPSLLARVSEICRPSLVVTDDDATGLVPAGARGAAIVSPTAWREVDPGLGPVASPSPTDTAVIQFTSGSTSAPKGCVLSHAAVVSNARAILDATRARPMDTGVCWLPLHHDMGLMSGVVTPVVGGASTCLLSPQRFLANPLAWLTALGAFPRTHTAAPNFALALVLQRLRHRAPASLDLSGVQTILCGAEPIDADLVSDFLAACSPYGLPPHALHAAYGMSETTVMATSKPGGLAFDEVDDQRLQHEKLAVPAARGRRSRRVVSLGTPPPGCAVRILSAQGDPLPERRVGQVHVRSTSCMVGYLKDPEATAEAIDGDWLRTGDLGYLADGQLFVTGRLKDQIIVAGRNLSPADIEYAVARATGLLTSRIAAVGRPGMLGTEEICIVVEARASEAQGLELLIRKGCYDACGLFPGAIEIVARGGIPRTSSGKIRRLELAGLLRDGALARAAEREMTPNVTEAT